MSWEGVGNIHYTKLRSLQDPRPHGKPNTEDEAAHNNSGQLTMGVKHGKWLERMMLHNRKYHSTRTTDRYVRGFLNKRSDANPHSTKETQYETCNVKVLLGVTPLLSVKLSSVWHLYSVWNFCSVWHLHSVWNFCSVWSFYYTGRFRFNTPPSSERGPRFLIVGRKQVSAYALWQCPCYRLWQGKNMYAYYLFASASTPTLPGSHLVSTQYNICIFMHKHICISTVCMFVYTCIHIDISHLCVCTFADGIFFVWFHSYSFSILDFLTTKI